MQPREGQGHVWVWTWILVVLVQIPPATLVCLSLECIENMEVSFLISTHCFGFGLLSKCWPLQQLIHNSNRIINNSVPFQSLSFNSSFPVTFVLSPLWTQFIHGVTVNHIWYLNRENYGFTTVTEFHVWGGTGEASWESNLSRQIEVRESNRHRRERGMKEKEKLKEKMASPLEVFSVLFLLHINLVMGCGPTANSTKATKNFKHRLRRKNQNDSF